MSILNHKYIYKDRKFKSSSYNRFYREESTRKVTTWEDIMHLTSSKQSCVKFLMDKHILANVYYCPKCLSPMDLKISSSKKSSSDAFVWKCRKMSNGERHQVERSIRCGSWLSDCNLTLEEIIKLIYRWSQDTEQKQVRIIYIFHIYSINNKAGGGISRGYVN